MFGMKNLGALGAIFNTGATDSTASTQWSGSDLLGLTSSSPATGPGGAGPSFGTASGDPFYSLMSDILDGPGGFADWIGTLSPGGGGTPSADLFSAYAPGGDIGDGYGGAGNIDGAGGGDGMFSSVLPMAQPPAAHWPASVAARAATPSANGFHVARDGPLDSTIARLQKTDPAGAAKLQQLAEQPVSEWLTGQPHDARNLRSYLDGAAAAGKEGLVTFYNIPSRDLGNHSRGGAGSAAEYRQWTQQMSAAIGDRKTTIYLEPDSIMHSAEMSAADGRARRQLLGETVAMLKKNNPNATVMLNAGSAGWGSPQEVAALLKDANIQQADGFFVNAAGFKSVDESKRHGDAIISALEQAGIAGKVFDIDTSRSGAKITAQGEAGWADPAGAASGPLPTVDQAIINDTNVRAYTWIKTPWLGDGRGKAGKLVVDYAMQLVDNAHRLGVW